VTGHWVLWHNGIEHGDISIGNLMCDLVTNRGVLNDFDLARFTAPDRTPSARDNTGTLPFLAMDLLNEEALRGGVRRLYRHDAESFAWCLIYICICMDKDNQGLIGTLNPHPLSPWFMDMAHCLNSKNTLSDVGLLRGFPLHHKINPLANELYNCWAGRYSKQLETRRLAGIGKGEALGVIPSEWIEAEETPQTTEPYEELPQEEWFKRVFQLFLKASNAIPTSRENIFYRMADLVITMYPFVKPSKSRANASKLVAV
jgi:hypothetical protein